MLFDQGFEQAQRIADHLGIGGGFGVLLEALQALHRLRRHFQLDARGGAFAIRALGGNEAGRSVIAVTPAAVAVHDQFPPEGGGGTSRRHCVSSS